MTSAKYFIDYKKINSDLITYDIYNQYHAKLIQNYIYNNNLQFTIKRGDVIETLKNDYRNNGLFMWDGADVLTLDFNVDEYGGVNSDFIVSNFEFSPDYWINNIAHNCYYYPCSKFRQEVYDTLTNDSKFTIEDVWYGYYMFNGKKHYVFIEIENIDDMEYILMNKNMPYSFNDGGDITFKKDNNITYSVAAKLTIDYRLCE